MRRYVAFNALLMLGAWALMQEVSRVAPALRTGGDAVAVQAPSRVEQFKLAEVAAASAPQVPVPRTIVADSVPEMPIQVLAVRIDQAEGVKVKPLREKRKGVRVGKASLRSRKAMAQASGTLPPFIVQTAAADAGLFNGARNSGRVGENSRDITNRSLGAMVALKN